MGKNKQPALGHVAPAPLAVSRSRKQFDALASELQELDAALAEWRQARDEARAFADRELRPLAVAYERRAKQVVLLLDQKYGEAKLDELERALLSSAITMMALELLGMEDSSDHDLFEAIFLRHSGIDVEPGGALRQAAFRTIVKEIYMATNRLSIDLTTPAGMAVAFALFDNAQAQEARRHARSTADNVAREAALRQHGEQMQAAVDELSSGLEEGGEMDRNLPKLLATRLAREGGGVSSPLSEKQFSAYNKLLKEEARHRALACAACIEEAAQGLEGYSAADLTLDNIMEVMNTAVTSTQDSLEHIERQIAIFQDTEKLKEWLREPGKPSPP